MEDDYGYDGEFVAYAEQAKGALAALIKSLVEVAAQPASGLSLEQEEHLTGETDAAAHHAVELTAVLSKIERPIDRGDAFQFALSIAEAAFYIGRYSVDGSLVEARKKLGASAGKASGEARRQEAAKWQKALLEAAQSTAASSIDKLASKATEALPKGAPSPPSQEAAVAYLRKEKAAGRVTIRKR